MQAQADLQAKQDSERLKLKLTLYVTKVGTLTTDVRDRLGDIEEVYKYLMMNSIEDEGWVPRNQVDRMLQKCSKVKALLKGSI